MNKNDLTAAADSENIFSALAEELPNMVFINQMGRLVYVNRKCVELMGYSREEFYSPSFDFRRLISPEYLGLIERNFAKHMRGQEVSPYEYLILTKEGKKIASRINTRLIEYGGKPAILGIISDISRQKQTEERLKCFKFISDNSNDAHFLVDCNAHFRYVNKTACKIMGYTEEELLRLKVPDVDVLYDLEKYRELFDLIQTETIPPIETLNRRKDGALFPSEISVTGYQIDGVPYMFAALRDSSERKRTEDALRSSEEQFRTIFENASVGIIVSDPFNRKFFLANSKMCSLTGYHKEELLDMRVEDLPPPSDLAFVLGQYYLAGRQLVNTALIPLSRKNGQVICCDICTSFINFAGQEMLVGFFKDITAEKHTKEALEKAVRELRHSNAELAQFVNIASHDLQEPLRMVTSYVQLLKRRYQDKLDENADTYISYAVEGATRMYRLINALLDYSRLGSRRKKSERVDCNAVVGHTLNNLQKKITDSQARIEVAPLPIVHGDYIQLMQLFQNLIKNAIKFRAGAPLRIDISAEARKGKAFFTIKDNGIGIAPQYHKRIFEIYQRLHSRREYPGTGIGLAICKKVVERHGGRIWVKSKSGAGAAFCFTLPLYKYNDFQP